MADMHDKVIEAVCNYYEDDQDTAADCLLYLATLKCLPLAVHAQVQLDAMGRCAVCGCKLERYTHRELHTELDEPCYETLTEIYCPNCDIPYREGTYVG